MNKKYKKIIIIIISIFAVLFIIHSILNYLYYKGIIFPQYAIFKNKIVKINDYNYKKNDSNDFIDDEFDKALRKIELKDKKLFAYTDNDIVIWKSNDSYKVQDFLWCDIDRDDENELVMLTWKSGRYGNFLPFWIKENDMSFDQHIFIYKFKNRTFKSIWKSSYIEADVKDLFFDDVNKILTLVDTTDYKARFAWFSFGLTSIKESKFDYDEKTDKIVDKLNIIAVGDNLIHKQIYEYGISNNKNFDFLYENVKKYLSKADLKVINQEGVFVDDDKEYSDYPKFGTPIEVLSAIKNAGFNLITFANNHILDKGINGINRTKEFCNKNNMDYIGIKDKNDKAYKILNINNIKIAVFNYTYGINGMSVEDVLKSDVYSLIDKKQLKRDLEEGVRKSDISVVFVHWGDEYNKNISDFQKEYANIFLSNGIDIVVGTHPHVLQKSEILKDSSGNELLIYYSLGNFVSYQKELENLIGGILDIEILKTNHGIKIKNYELRPTYTYRNNNSSTVYLLDEYKKIYDSLDNDNYFKYNYNITEIENVAYSLINQIDKNKIYKRLHNIRDITKMDEFDDIEQLETIKLGHFEQDNNLSNGKESIEWIVMSKKDGMAYLTSKYILDYIPFDKSKDESKEINAIDYKKTYMYYYIYNTFVKETFTNEEIDLLNNKNVSLACTFRYNSIGFDYTNPKYMKATETEYAKSKNDKTNTNEYWILNKCDTSNALDKTTNREKFVLQDGNIAYDGYRNDDEKTMANKNTNIYEKKGFRPFICIKYE